MFKIGIIGKMGAGKTAVSDALIEKYSGQRAAFADALKEDVIKYKLTPDGTIDKKRDRKTLQNYGQLRRGELTELSGVENLKVRNVNGTCYLEKSSIDNGLKTVAYNYIGTCEPNHWVNQLVDKVNACEGNVIVDDIRRINEAKALSEIGFKIVKISAPDELRFARLSERDGSFNPDTLNNISETEVDNIPCDYLFNNDKSLESVLSLIELDLNLNT